MSIKKPTFAVLGTGNSGQAFAADITLKGFSVNLAEVPEFASTLQAIEKKGGIEISGEAGNGFAALNMITTDIEKAIKGVDIIIIGGSAFAHEPFAKVLAPYVEDGQFILLVSNFGAIRFQKIMKELDIKINVIPVESTSLIYATRAPEPGNVSVIGLKDNLPVATMPSNRTEEFIEKISPVFPQMIPCESVLFTSLNNMNPVIHPPMVLFNAGRIEATGGKGWNLYQEGATESVAKMMLAIDAERMSLMGHLGMNGIALKEIFESMYKKYSVGRMTVSETLRQSPIHTNPAFPAPPSIDTRYLTEDLPFGLVPWSSLGHLWNVPTPTIDAVIQTASVMLEKNYFEEGITAKDLGVDGMSPEEVRKMVE